MGTTYVQGRVHGDQCAEDVVRALRDRGFFPQQIEVQRTPGEPPQQHMRRRRHEVVRDALVGAAMGALCVAPLGAIAPGTLAQVEMAAWFEQLVSTSVAMATLQSLFVGGVIGGVFGAVVGLYRQEPIPAAQAYFRVIVRAEGDAADQAAIVLRRSGSSDVQTQPTG